MEQLLNNYQSELLNGMVSNQNLFKIERELFDKVNAFISEYLTESDKPFKRIVKSHTETAKEVIFLLEEKKSIQLEFIVEGYYNKLVSRLLIKVRNSYELLELFKFDYDTDSADKLRNKIKSLCDLI